MGPGLRAAGWGLLAAGAMWNFLDFVQYSRDALKEFKDNKQANQDWDKAVTELAPEPSKTD